MFIIPPTFWEALLQVFLQDMQDIGSSVNLWGRKKTKRQYKLLRTEGLRYEKRFLWIVNYKIPQEGIKAVTLPEMEAGRN